MVVAVAEHRPLDRALHPPADRQQHDRGDRRSASRRPSVCSWSKKSRAGVVMPIAYSTVMNAEDDRTTRRARSASATS